MGLIERLKVALGLAPREPSTRGAEQESTGQDVAVTVEHDPETDSEDAVKGTDTGTAASTEGEAAESSTETDESSAEAESAETDTADGDDETAGSEPTDDDAASADVQSIDGIGPAYAERLAEAEIETVADLAGADAGSVAEQTGIAEGRVSTWIERAGE